MHHIRQGQTQPFAPSPPPMPDAAPGVCGVQPLLAPRIMHLGQALDHALAKISRAQYNAYASCDPLTLDHYHKLLALDVNASTLLRMGTQPLAYNEAAPLLAKIAMVVGGGLGALAQYGSPWSFVRGKVEPHYTQHGVTDILRMHPNYRAVSYFLAQFVRGGCLPPNFNDPASWAYARFVLLPIAQAFSVGSWAGALQASDVLGVRGAHGCMSRIERMLSVGMLGADDPQSEQPCAGYAGSDVFMEPGPNGQASPPQSGYQVLMPTMPCPGRVLALPGQQGALHPRRPSRASTPQAASPFGLQH